MSSRILYLLGLSLVMMDFSRLNLFNSAYYLSERIPEEKNNYSFYKTKTYHQNPNLKQKISYYNKTIPKNRFTQISQKGLNIQKDNQRKNLLNKFNKEMNEKNIERALKR